MQTCSGKNQAESGPNSMEFLVVTVVVYFSFFVFSCVGPASNDLLSFALTLPCARFSYWIRCLCVWCVNVSHGKWKMEPSMDNVKKKTTITQTEKLLTLFWWMVRGSHVCAASYVQCMRLINASTPNVALIARYPHTHTPGSDAESCVTPMGFHWGVRAYA